MKKGIITVLMMLAVLVLSVSVSSADYADKNDIAAIKHAILKLNELKRMVQGSLEKTKYQVEKNEGLYQTLDSMVNLIPAEVKKDINEMTDQDREVNESIKFIKQRVELLRDNAKQAEENQVKEEKLLRDIERKIESLKTALDVREAFSMIKSELDAGTILPSR